MSAFSLFLAEVWEMILDQMKDSKDVLNAFQAFPELEMEGILKQKRHLWMFDQVIPHLVPWLKSKEILACRQVCTQWSWAVDNFIDNHPFKRAYEHGSSITGQLWIPAASSQAKYRLQLPIQLHKFTNGGSFPVYNHAKFISEMELHPMARNPFVGRLIEIQTHRYQFKRDSAVEPHLLLKHGNHLWFLKTSLGNSLNVKNLLTWLTHLPNLKRLELSEQRKRYSDFEGNKDEKRYLDSREYFIPPLPHLETLVFTVIDDVETEEMPWPYSLPLPNYVINLFVTSYSTQIRRLTIQVDLWEKEYSNLFPNLTELEFQVKWGAYFIGPGKLKIDDFLMALNSPKLFSLQLLFDRDFLPYFRRLRIFQVISKQFLQLNSFSLSYSGGKENSLGLLLPSDPTLSIPSLKSLVLWDRCNSLASNAMMRYDSLKSFPSLEYLKISGLANEVDMAQVWPLLPTLRELTTERRERYNIHIEISYRRDARLSIF